MGYRWGSWYKYYILAGRVQASYFCPFDIARKDFFLLCVLFQMKIFCPEWLYFAEAICLFCFFFCILFSNVYPKIKFTATNLSDLCNFYSKVIVRKFCLIILFVDLWFILRGDLLYVFPCVILFLCCSVLLVLRLPRLGKRELILVFFVR